MKPLYSVSEKRNKRRDRGVGQQLPAPEATFSPRLLVIRALARAAANSRNWIFIGVRSRHSRRLQFAGRFARFSPAGEIIREHANLPRDRYRRDSVWDEPNTELESAGGCLPLLELTPSCSEVGRIYAISRLSFLSFLCVFLHTCVFASMKKWIESYVAMTMSFVKSSIRILGIRVYEIPRLGSYDICI